MVGFKSLAVALLTAVSTVQAHYVYSILTIDGQRTNDWQYSTHPLPTYLLIHAFFPLFCKAPPS